MLCFKDLYRLHHLILVLHGLDQAGHFDALPTTVHHPTCGEDHHLDPDARRRRIGDGGRDQLRHELRAFHDAKGRWHPYRMSPQEQCRLVASRGQSRDGHHHPRHPRALDLALADAYATEEWCAPDLIGRASVSLPF